MNTDSSTEKLWRILEGLLLMRLALNIFTFGLQILIDHRERNADYYEYFSEEQIRRLYQSLIKETQQ